MSVRERVASIHSWIPEPVPRDVELSLDRLARSEDVRHLAVMPDVHLSHDVCVGVAAATSRLIYPAAVGGDIGCGMAALRLESDAGLLDDDRSAARVLALLYRSVPGNKH